MTRVVLVCFLLTTTAVWAFVPSRSSNTPSFATSVQRQHILRTHHVSARKRTDLLMAEATMWTPIGRWENPSPSRSFLSNYPLSYYSSDLLFPPNSRRGATSTFSFLNDADYEEDEYDEEILKYLPYYETQQDYLPPLTRDILSRVTYQYISNGNPKQPNLHRELLSVMNDEYKTTKDVNVQIGDTFIQDENIVKILSFAALYRLPKEITVLLFNPNDKQLRNLYERVCWEGVSFPNGLGLGQIKRYYTSSNNNSPTNWRLTRRRQRARQYAALAVKEAAETKPPAKRPTRQEFLASMEQAWDGGLNTSLIPSSSFLFFPKRKRLGKRLRRALRGTLSLIFFQPVIYAIRMAASGLSSSYGKLRKVLFVSWASR